MTFRRRSTLALSAGILLMAAMLMAVGGCTSEPQKRPKPKPKPAKNEPIRIDWASPASVVEGFFDAKKRGDWRKAYNCCDFEQRLSKEEAKQIRDEWKREAHLWPDMYANSSWFIAEFEAEGDIALVSVVHVEYGGPGELDETRTGFDELCKRYGERWKITEFTLPPERESE
jgi:hypothetical protein